MLQFFVNNWGTILTGTALLAILAVIVVKMCRERKKGKTSCGCGCDHCPSSGMCHKK